MTDFESLFTQAYATLNDQQRAAVDHIDGPLIVLAGAGTGKTQIIALRIANLLRQTQVDPQNILCLTFTETGATTMRKRLINIIGPAAYHVTIGTFHSFCNDIIQQHPEYFLLAQDLTPLDDVEQIKIFKDVLDATAPDSPLKPFAAPYFYIRALASAIQTLKRENINVAEYRKLVDTSHAALEANGEVFETFISIHGRSLKEEHILAFTGALDTTEAASIHRDISTLLAQHESPAKFKQAVKRYYESAKSQLPKQKALTEIYDAYQQQLQKRGRYDYEDMLLFVVDAFEQHEELLAKYQEQYQYILVDEYQDTNGAQNRVVELLGSYFDDPNIFVVGDDRQSIYRFQGASLENILYFTERYGERTKFLSLQTNYRSHQIILDAASGLIAHNQRSIAQLRPEMQVHLQAAQSEQETPVTIGEFSTSQVEYYWIAQQIQQLLAQGIAPSEIAILYRNNSDADDVIDVLQYFEIPFYLNAGIDILRDHQVNKLVTVLRYVAGMAAEDTLYYVLQYDFFNLDPVDVMKAHVYSRSNKQPLFQVISDPELQTAAGIVTTEQFSNFAQQLLRWRTIAVNEPICRFFEQLLDESGFLTHIMELPERVEHLNRVNTLYEQLKHLNRATNGLQIKDFVEYLDLLADHSLSIQEQELHTKREAVRLMTAHQAKGLEFAHVFIIRCTDKHWGNVPNRNKLSLPQGIIHNDISYDVKEKNEDERRLFYVAMTRAKQRLYITYPQQSGTGRAVVPSLFVTEIPEQLTERINVESVEDEAFTRLQVALLQAPAFNFGEREREYIRDLLENYTLSASHLNAYLDCPKNFFFSRILRVPEPKGRDVSFGTAVHNTLRDAARLLADGKKVSAKTAEQIYEKHLTEQVMKQRDFEETLQFGKPIITEYIKEHATRLSTLRDPERNFTPDGVHFDGIPLGGSIDAMELVDETSRTIHVIDYKTGNPDNKAPKLSKQGEYHRQLMFYKLLCDGSPRFPFTAVSGEINFVQPSKKKHEYIKKVYEFSSEDITDFKTVVTQVYQDIISLKFLDAPAEQMCGDCRYCTLFE